MPMYTLTNMSKKLLTEWYYEGKLKERAYYGLSHREKVAIIDINEDYVFGYIASPNNDTIKFFKVKVHINHIGDTSFRVANNTYNVEDFLRVNI